MRNPILLSAFVIFCTTLALPAASPFEIDGIRFGLERSPDDFVAGVFELIGPLRCDSGSQPGPLCWVRVLVVDEIVSRPTSKAPRIELKVLAAGKPGERLTGRFVAFLIPIEGTDIYAGSFSGAYGRKQHQRFRRLVETAITGERLL